METKNSPNDVAKLWVAFYPTYKEWKPTLDPIELPAISPFYPTYKEWKLFSTNSAFSSGRTFYPTYKEWKLIKPMYIYNASSNFLSYL